MQRGKRFAVGILTGFLVSMCAWGNEPASERGTLRVKHTHPQWFYGAMGGPSGSADSSRLPYRIALLEPRYPAQAAEAPKPHLAKQDFKSNPPTAPVDPIQLDVRVVEESVVNVMLQQASLREILLAIAPPCWKITVDSARPAIREGRWNFYTSTQRREALSDLLSPLGLTYHLFPDFKDKKGNPAPVLLVGDSRATGGVGDHHDE